MVVRWSRYLREAVTTSIEELGADHRETLLIKGKAARLALAVSGDKEPLRAVVERMEAVLGAAHDETAKYKKVLAEA